MKVLVTGTEGYLGSLLAPTLLAEGHDVAHTDRHAAAAVEHDRADLVEPGHLARHPHQELLPVALDVARADVLVVGRDRATRRLSERASFAAPRSTRDTAGCG